jgi:hypothetical protein
MFHLSLLTRRGAFAIKLSGVPRKWSISGLLSGIGALNTVRDKRNILAIMYEIVRFELVSISRNIYFLHIKEMTSDVSVEWAH